MGKKVRSARGEMVDFDLLRIKEEMAAAPQSLHVRKRKDFIEQRLRRKIKSIACDMEEKKEETKKGVVAAQQMSVEPKLPDTEVVEEEKTEELVEVKAAKPEATKTPTKQRARKKPTTEEGEKTDGAESNS